MDANIALLGFASLVFLLGPFVLLVWYKRRSGASLAAFGVGALCFVLFSMVLESLLHQLVLRPGGAILSSPALYCLYGCLAAGIFEETGRLFGFKVLLRKHREPSSAVAYGIGHGGIEVILVAGLSYLLYLLVALGVPLGQAESMARLAASAAAITPAAAALAALERCSAVMLHIGLSQLVFVSVRSKGKLWLYPLAIVLHALADVPAALLQSGVSLPLPLVEGLLFLIGAAILLLGCRARRRSIPKEHQQTEVA